MAEEELPEELGGAGGQEQPAGSEGQRTEDDFGEKVSDDINTGQNIRDAYRWGKKKFFPGPKGVEGVEGGSEEAGAEAKGSKKGLKGVEKKAKGLKKVPTPVGGAGAAGGEAAATVGAEVAVTAGAAEAGATVGSVVPVVGTAIGLAVGWLVGKLLPKAINFVKNNWTKPVYIIAGLFILLAIPFALLGLKGGGKITPTTSTQLFQSQALLPYIGGDFVLSGGKINEKVYQAEKERYAIIQHNVDTDPRVSGRSAEVKKSINEILQLIDSGRNLSGDPKKKITADTIAKIQALDSTLPFGSWIAAAARNQVGKPSGNFCTITQAGGRVACASFVSTVLQNAGIPNPIQAGVDGIWRRTFYKIVVNRPDIKSTGHYNLNKSKLQIGDIIFWGDGSCSKGGSVLFDHIGFYVGGDEAVDNSSGGKDGTPPPQIRKRGAASRSSCIVFNGAKRYGSDL